MLPDSLAYLKKAEQKHYKLLLHVGQMHLWLHQLLSATFCSPCGSRCSEDAILTHIRTHKYEVLT